MAERTLILAFETSCDETSVAVVENGTKILSNIVATQIDSHQRFGGVVPEVASRHHIEWITRCIHQALDEAGVDYDDLEEAWHEFLSYSPEVKEDSILYVELLFNRFKI